MYEAAAFSYARYTHYTAGSAQSGCFEPAQVISALSDDNEDAMAMGALFPGSLSSNGRWE